MKIKNRLILSVVLCLLPIVVGAAVYPLLPQEIAIHWDVNNVPDNYVSKPLALFLMPVFFAAIQGFACLSVWRAAKHVQALPKVIAVAVWILPVVFSVAYTLMLLWAFGQKVDSGTIALLVVGLSFILLGNYFPKIKYDDSKFIISAPVFKSERSFRRGMRAFGLLFMVAGLALFITAIVC